MSLLKPSELRPLAGLSMRTVLQRCRHAEVRVAAQSCGTLPAGLLALVGFSALPEDELHASEELLLISPALVKTSVEPLFQRWWNKVSQLRIFPDAAGKMNHSILQMPPDFGIYLVSQFTLFADLRKGNRPSYGHAMPAALAKVCFEHLFEFVRSRASERAICSGLFGADMAVSFVNDGPVTLMFDCSNEHGIVSL